MTDFATLGMDVDSRGLVKGREELDRLTAAGAKAERGVGSLEGRSKTLSKAMRRLAVAAGGVAASLLTAFASGQSIRAAQAYETRTARINAVLEATGGIAGKTSRQLEQQAQSLARATLESVDGVRSAQQTLLTFLTALSKAHWTFRRQWEAMLKARHCSLPRRWKTRLRA